MDLARRLSTALYGATEKGTGLETADVNDQETLRAMTPEKPQPARRKTIIGSNGSGSGDACDALAPPAPGQASASDAAVMRYPRKLGEGRGKKLWESC